MFPNAPPTDFQSTRFTSERIPQQDPVTRPATPQVESNALLRGTRELLIQHGGQTYRLRHTRNDKLILTK